MLLSQGVDELLFQKNGREKHCGQLSLQHGRIFYQLSCNVKNIGVVTPPKPRKTHLWEGEGIFGIEESLFLFLFPFMKVAFLLRKRSKLHDYVKISQILQNNAF